MTQDNGINEAPLPNQFLLVLQDNGDQLDVGGMQRPEQHDDKSPAHVVGAFIRDNLAMIIAAAQHDWRQRNAPADEAAPKLITSDRERTIILPEGATS